MKKKREVAWLALLFSTALLITSLVTGDFAESLAGLQTIILSPAQLTLDYFKIGTVGGTFLNVALVGYACVLLLFYAHEWASGLSLMTYFLTVGFSFFGINIMNIWPIFAGTWIYARVFKKSYASQVNFAMFATSLAPFVSEMVVRYPVFEGMPGELGLRILAAIFIGMLCGFLLPILCAHGPNLHKGYSLYNAASVSGFIAIVLYAILFRATGNEIPSNTDIGGSYPALADGFALTVSGLMVLAGFWMNGRSFQGCKEILLSTAHRVDFVKENGFAPTLINIGTVGLAATLYYHVTGAPFTGPTVGCIVCLLAVAPCGTTVANLLPIMAGYAIAASFCSFELSTQAIAVGLCFAGALSPISGRFGSLCGVAAGLLHACIVTTVVTFHGGFCLYNGGFTAGVVAIFLIPILEAFFEPNHKAAVLPLLKR